MEHAPEYSFGLLVGVPGFLFTRRRNDRVPPHIGRQLASRCFLGSDQAGRHVWLPVDFLRIEVIGIGIFHVHQNVVVLGRPLVLASGSVVVRPDDLVEKVVSPKK